jgi:hypothetical protein
MVDYPSIVHDDQLIAGLEEGGAVSDEDNHLLFAERLNAPPKYLSGDLIVD